MNAADLIILAILALGSLWGFSRGFIVQVAAILGAVVALAIAKAEYTVVRQALESVAAKSPWLTAISYLIVFLAVWGAIVVVARRIRWLVRLLFLGWADRLGGAIIGFLQGALVVELLLYLGKRVPSAELHHLIKHATLAPTFLHLLPYIDTLFPHVSPY